MSAKIEGLAALVKGLEELGGMKAVRGAMRGAALYIKSKINVYPPASEGNQPDQRRWYQRGWGTKWMRKDGSIGGSKTSETLGRKWTTELINGGMVAEVGNNVSYGPYVQDKDHQALFHEARGWKVIQDVAEDEAPHVRDLISKAIQAELDRIASATR